jgi:glycosyltransferase involved in cell wall biosynthesis
VRITIVQGPFLPVPPLLGGAVEKVWFSLGQEFARRGHRVTHVSRDFKDLPARETIEGVQHRRISGFSSPATFSRRMLLDFWYAARVLGQLPAADILVTNTFWLPVLERRRSRGRIYVHVARYPKGQMKLYRRAVLQTVSAPIKEAILADDAAAAGRVRVIPYPLSPRYFSPQLEAGEKVILYTGRIHPEKGVHLLLQAFAAVAAEARAGWRLVIVGPHEIAFGGGGEDYFRQLQEIAAPVRSDVDFTGRIFDENRLIEQYRRARIFAYPSLAEKGETFGLSVLEAMAAGCAPIVSNLACFQDFIRAEDNGRIFDHRDAAPALRLAEALTGLLRDTVVLESLRAAAWRTAQAYTLPVIADQFLDDFSQILSPASAR